MVATVLAALIVTVIVASSSAPDNTLAIDGAEPSPTPSDVSQIDEPAPVALGNWRTIASGRLAARQGVVSAWTGEEMLVWGGRVTARHIWFEDGEAYRPGADEWRRIAPSPLAPRAGAASAWTGKELLVWGGVGKGRTADGRLRAVPLRDGAAYDPGTDRWRRLPRAPLSPRRQPAAVWAGDSFVVWGGQAHDGGDELTDGARYDPTTNRWRRLPPGPLTGARLRDAQLAAVGRDVLVWATSPRGRHITAVYLSDENAWREIRAPALRDGTAPVIAEVTGTALAWGVRPDGRPLAVRLAADERLWASIPTPPRSPAPSESFVAAGARVVAWQGSQGLIFDVARNTWTATPQAPALGPGAPAHAWTGDRLIVWHSGGRPGDERRGAVWTPGNPWQALTPPQPIAPGASVIWTGSRRHEQQLLIWGGQPGRDSAPVVRPVSLGGTPPPEEPPRPAGFVYDAVLGLWENLPAAPIAPRRDHAAVWVGAEMFVLGGRGGTPGSEPATDAAAYNPATRQWRRVPAPTVAVVDGGAVFTGRRLLVIGLDDRTVGAADYDHEADQWTPLPRPPLPAGAEQIAAVWSEFEVWAIAVLPDGALEAAAWNPRRRSWRPLPGTHGLRGPIAMAWAQNRVYVVDALGRTRSYGRRDTVWRTSPRAPIRSDATTLAWNGHSLLAMDPRNGDIATLGPRATTWAAFEGPGLRHASAGRLVATGRDVIAVSGGELAVLSGVAR